MAQIINTNIASLTAQRNLNNSQSANATALERLSSGLRINSAKDDAAGLAISTRFESQTRGLGQAVRNAGDGISLAQTAEGALQSITDNLQRVRELAVQSANGTNSDDDRAALQAEVSQLVAEIERTSSETNFNGRNLFDGNFDGLFQIGANAGQTVGIEIGELTTSKLGASEQVGVSAFGTDDALANGDLSINGVAIGASRSSDDTASTANAAASGIAKAAAINRYTDETGVTAFANQNIASGTEMEGASVDGTIRLNGVKIDFSSSNDTTATRASVAQAINAVSDQTGVRAVDTESDVGGVQLVAEDGRNIDLSLEDGLTSANTGLAATGTYEGGYTLISSGDRNAIEISGGDGTGNGDLTRAGLTEGTYTRATAVSVTESQSQSVTAATIGGGSLANTLARADSGSEVLANTSGDSVINTAGTVGDLTLGVATRATVNVGGTETVIDFGTTASIAELAAATAGTSSSGGAFSINEISGVTAYEQIEFTIGDYATTADSRLVLTTDTGGESYINVSQTLDGTAAVPSLATRDQRLSALADEINGTNFGDGISVTAELNFAKDGLNVRIDNSTGGRLELGETAGDLNVTTNLDGDLDTADDLAAGSTYTLAGSLAFSSDDAGTEVSVVLSSSSDMSAGGSDRFFVGGTGGGSTTLTDYGDTALSTTGENEVSIKVGDNAPTSVQLAADSTVADLASQVNAQDGVNAWEEIALTVSKSTLGTGDSINVGGQSIGVTAQGPQAATITIDGDDLETLSEADLNGGNLTLDFDRDGLSGTGGTDTISVTFDNDFSDGNGSGTDGAYTAQEIAAAFNSNTDLQAGGLEAYADGDNLVFATTTGGENRSLTATVNAAGNSGLADTNLTDTAAGTNGDLEQLVADINGADLSGANVEATAVLADDGASFSLTLRNYSGDAVNVSTSTGAGLELSGGELIGTEARQLSGELKFTSEDDRDVSVTVSDPDANAEFNAGASATADFTGVNGLEDGDLVINGVTIGAARQSADTASAVRDSEGNQILSSSKSLSAIAVAASINDVSEETGVTAEVNATRVVGGTGENADPDSFEIGDQADLYINGVSLGTVTLQADSSGNIDTDRARTDALNLINDNSLKTGVTAEDNGVSITMTAEDGRNVSVAIDDKSGSDASIGALFGMDAAVDGIGESTFGGNESLPTGASVSSEASTYETTYGTLELTSAGSFDVELGSNGAAEIEALGLRVGSYGGGEDGTFLKDIDISTLEGANAALTSVDNALESVSAVRSELGALQNRLESTIGNLEITQENLTAANSRIRDADFAAESAELSRTQVLQQAGISILAQANQRPQQVLTLLG